MKEIDELYEKALKYNEGWDEKEDKQYALLE